LVRTVCYHGTHVKIDAGKIKQEFDDKKSDGWKKTVSFLGLGGKGTVSEYRQIAPGAWLPNVCSSAGGSIRVIHKVDFLAINENVDSEFSMRGR
jgi:hypothetical protein